MNIIKIKILILFAILQCGRSAEEKKDENIFNQRNANTWPNPETMPVPLTEVKNQRNAPCPYEEDITPCLCSFDESYRITMDCSNVSTQLHLRNIFDKPYPENNMYMFTMDQSSTQSIIGHLDPGLFGMKTFQVVELSNIQFNFSISIFDHMNATLQTLDITSAPIYKFNYNFNAYTALTYIYVNCPLSDFLISSPSLVTLFITSGYITERDDNNPYLFGAMQNLESLHIDLSTLYHMPDTSGYPKLTYIYIHQSYINLADTFMQPTNYLNFFVLCHSDVEDISTDSIRLAEDSNIGMYNNQLHYLDQKKWGNIFDNASSINLRENPFECGCDIAWIFGQDPNGTFYRDKLHGDESCHDGVLFVDLDKDYYNTIC